MPGARRARERRESTMNDREFEDAVDETFANLEDDLDELDEHDIDIDSAGGILTVTCPDASQIIFSRQPANREIWVAARSGGFHLARDGDRWTCGTTGESLGALSSRVLTEQLGTPVEVLG